MAMTKAERAAQAEKTKHTVIKANSATLTAKNVNAFQSGADMFKDNALRLCGLLGSMTIPNNMKAGPAKQILFNAFMDKVGAHYNWGEKSLKNRKSEYKGLCVDFTKGELTTLFNAVYNDTKCHDGSKLNGSRGSVVKAIRPKLKALKDDGKAINQKVIKGLAVAHLKTCKVQGAKGKTTTSKRTKSFMTRVAKDLKTAEGGGQYKTKKGNKSYKIERFTADELKSIKAARAAIERMGAFIEANTPK